jgi:hypothetical protein
MHTRYARAYWEAYGSEAREGKSKRPWVQVTPCFVLILGTPSFSLDPAENDGD